MDLNDELLCAYLDGELDPASREKVEIALTADAGARLRLARMEAADHALTAALPLPGADHFEASMTARIRGLAPLVPRRRMVLPWAAAAAITGIFAGYLLPRSGLAPGVATGFAHIDGALEQVLESGRSGVAASSGPAVVLTFAAADTRFCRVFRGDAGQAAGEGLACRDSGKWTLVAWDAAAGSSSQAYRTAGASTLIDAAMDALGGQPSLGSDEEAALINAGWSSAR